MSATMRNGYLFLLALCQTGVAGAAEWTWSGFGTLGYAQSNQPYKYQRFIDDEGTFMRDSILGAQLDLKLNPQWGATVQARLAPAEDHDQAWEASLAWAFVSWRPQDDWLIRAGKLRLPLMLNTENRDVGATYEFARLPIEVYSIAPTTDVVGLSISKTWLLGSYDWTVEAYTGNMPIYWRYYEREIGTQRSGPGSMFVELDVRSSGLVLTARDIDNVFRIGIHEVVAKRVGESTHADIPFRSLGPGFGYYDLNNARRIDQMIVPVQTLGASVLLPGDVRLTGEYAHIKVDSSSEGLSRWGGYLAVSKQFGEWTPYFYYAKMKSPDNVLEHYKKINRNRVPSLPPPYNSTRINQSQILAADILSPYDQWTGAIGTSYRLTPTSVLKAEWSHTDSGVVSSFIDAPRGSDSANRHINVFSLSYSFTF
nr:hypothetical protein [Dechloromonas sp.]